MIMKAKNINTKHPDLKKMKPLQPCGAYFSGRVNSAKLYHKCEGMVSIHYIGVIRMFPYIMSDPTFHYLTEVPVVLVKSRDMLIPINEVFGVIKVLIEALNNLYFPILPECAPNRNAIYVL